MGPPACLPMPGSKRTIYGAFIGLILGLLVMHSPAVSRTAVNLRVHIFSAPPVSEATNSCNTLVESTRFEENPAKIGVLLANLGDSHLGCRV